MLQIHHLKNLILLFSTLIILVGCNGYKQPYIEEGKNLIFLQNMVCQLSSYSFSGNTSFICVSKEEQENFQKVKSFDFPTSYTLVGDSLFPLTILTIDEFPLYDQSIIKKEILEKGYDIAKIMFLFVEIINTDTKVRVDLDSFEAIDLNYSKDENSVYFHGRTVSGIDPKTIKFIDNQRVQDKNWVVYNGEIISEVHGDVIIINNEYWKDYTTVFYHGTKKSELDPKTFEIFYNSFSKDKSGVYWTTGEKIPLLDPSSFETKGWIWGTDKEYISCGNTIIPHSDSTTFRNYENGVNLTLGNYGFAGDKNFVYFCGLNIPITLKDADPESFKSLMFIEDGAPPNFWKGKDKNHTYQCNLASGVCTKNN